MYSRKNIQYEKNYTMIPPIFINHYPPLVERKKYLESVLKNPTWVTEPLKENITEEIKNEWYKDSPEEWTSRCKSYGCRFSHRKMKEGDIACSLGHIFSWEKFVSTNEKYGVFFEDDVVITCNDFEEKISQVLEQVPEDLDVLFIGGGFNHDYVTKTIKVVNEKFHLKKAPNTNCACSYVLTNRAAQKLLLECKPFVMPIDFEMNYWFNKLEFKVYHHIPYFIKEGSKTGQYKSTQVGR